MRSKKLPINVTTGEEQQVSLESVDVYFQDVFRLVSPVLYFHHLLGERRLVKAYVTLNCHWWRG